MVTSAQVLTVSGAVVTHFITSTPTPAPTPDQSNEVPHQTNNGLSKGAVAGITIGALVAAAIIGLLILVIFWRRRRNNKDDSEGGIKRNASVLSKVGLLAGGDSSVSRPGEAHLPRIKTTGISTSSEGTFGPDSAATFGSSQMSDARRNSRPMFVDNRLNPNALMAHVNSSRSSVGTLQDNQDYSRPLEVRNPDG